MFSVRGYSGIDSVAGIVSDGAVRDLSLIDISDVSGNFGFIYGSEQHKAEFYKFLSNVFHLYPEEKLHELISVSTSKHSADQDIYQFIQSNIDDIKPFLAELSYAVPALIKQKQTMAEQALALLPEIKRIDGYLELGSNGRYLDALNSGFTIEGQKVFISERAPTFSLADMISRGSISKAGDYIDLNQYQPDIAASVAPNSLDMVTVFIGFHHCPKALRQAFISGLRDVLKPGGSLIVRDHNAHNEKMIRMVALAHDVFNAGTNESVDYNRQELRNFYSLEYLDTLLKGAGFKSDGRRLYQAGDPTMNALMLYTKV